MRSCLNGGGGCSPLTTGGSSPLTTGGGGGGGGGCSRQVTLINSSLTCTHSLLKHKKHHGKRVHSAPALSCSTASLTFVRTTELSGLLSMAQHVICRSLSSERGGRQKLPGGGISYAMGGAAAPPPPPPPKAMLDPGLNGSGSRRYNGAIRAGNLNQLCTAVSL